MVNKRLQSVNETGSAVAKLCSHWTPHLLFHCLTKVMILKPKSGAALGGPDCMMGERERDKNKKSRWLVSAPLVPFLFLSSSLSTSEGLSVLQPHHGGCARGMRVQGRRTWQQGIEAQWLWGLRVDVGEAVRAVQPSTAWEAWEMMGDEAQDLRKMLQAKERTPDLPPESNVKDTPQTDSSCLTAAGNMDPRYFQTTYFLHSFTPINHSCL